MRYKRKRDAAIAAKAGVVTLGVLSASVRGGVGNVSVDESVAALSLPSTSALVTGSAGGSSRALGLNIQVSWSWPTAHAQQVARFVESGCQYARLPIYWQQIETSNGVYGDRLDRYDDWFAQAHAAGIKTLGVFQGAPTWASLDGADGSGVSAAHYADFADFAAWCANRWVGQGLEALEMWNEANLSQFFTGGGNGGILGDYPGTQLSRYSDIIKLWYPAVKAAAPTVICLGGGSFSVGMWDWRVSTFHNALTTYDAWPYMDAFSWHNYPMHVSTKFPSITSPNQPWYNPTTPDQSIFGMFEEEILPIMEAAGVGGMDTWCTESGYTTVGTGSNNCTLAQQATKVGEFMTDFASESTLPPTLRRFYYYNLFDGNASQNADPEQNWGLIDRTGDNYADMPISEQSPKPSWSTWVSGTKVW